MDGTQITKAFRAVNLAVMNQFVFWKADLEFRLQLVKTPYHSGRLKAVIAYGAPTIEVWALEHLSQ